MWVRIALLPVVWVFSVAATITRHIGQLIPIAKLHSYLFHRLVGGEEKALKVRDELIERAESYLKEIGTDIEKTPEELVAEIENSRERASTAISSGEFILILVIGFAGFYVSEWYVLAISVLVALSASLRITAVDTLAISAPDSAHSVEWLTAALGWNKGAVEGSRLLFLSASAVGLREVDEQAFEVFLEEVFVPSLDQGGMSLSEGLRRFTPKIWELVNSDTSP